MSVEIEKPLRAEGAKNLTTDLGRSGTDKLHTTAIICNPAGTCNGSHELGEKAAEHYSCKGGSELNYLAELTAGLCTCCRTSFLAGYFGRKDELQVTLPE